MKNLLYVIYGKAGFYANNAETVFLLVLSDKIPKSKAFLVTFFQKIAQLPTTKSIFG